MKKIEVDNNTIHYDFPYFQCPNKIFDEDYLPIYDTVKNITRNIDVYEQMILIYLFRCCNNGKSAFPSYATISKKCRCSKRKAVLAVDNLFNSKYIIKKHRGFIKDQEHQVNKNQSNVYYINKEKMQELI